MGIDRTYIAHRVSVVSIVTIETANRRDYLRKLT